VVPERDRCHEQGPQGVHVQLAAEA
jgi:hypothetical protein